jgi:hypothetical protein
MELAGLEPATSWVRSVRDVDSEGTKGMVQPFPRQLRAGISPPFPRSTHHELTTHSVMSLDMPFSGMYDTPVN